jgi:hypothetical protein
MRTFVLHHRHEAHECDATFAAWAGFRSPLRHEPVRSTCLDGGHGLYWVVQATDRDGALALLPRYVAQRTSAIQVREVEIP